MSFVTTINSFTYYRPQNLNLKPKIEEIWTHFLGNINVTAYGQCVFT